ncbi:hypothetical protein [Nocardia stercoris]|uniref:Uncharacterized protein n=1 Tax=Nocardia stercoris TaxID=2483361 RepID=A0A3M2LA54_9NOCA|nr:hypothetical protein [Nocardia stercoris]RMI33580.1 hypothetical protein EBN03_10785 [Nocardia stercoris]
MDPSMAAHGRVTDEIRAYRTYTGESAQTARWIQPSHRTSIPSATGDQMRLEAEILDHLTFSREWSLHPFSISRVRPQRDALVLDVDERIAAFGETDDAATDVLRRLVPSVDAGDGSFVTGVAGLRLGLIQGRSLELRMADTSAVVVLRCAPHARWRASVDTVHADLQELGQRPLWDAGAGVGDIERDYIGWQLRSFPEFGWLGSALLRRLYLFHSTSQAFYTKGWSSFGQFRFELNSTTTAGAYHRRFVDRLTDTRLGIPLVVKDIDCYCDSAGSARSATCWIELGPPSGHKSILQLRFCHNPQPRTIGFRPDFKNLDADRRWLDRVLPPA